jgi:SAM-dependent methyltransferase
MQSVRMPGSLLMANNIVLETVGCPFCKMEYDNTFWKENGYIGRKCYKCGLIYISPRPTEIEMSRLYEIGNAGGAKAENHIVCNYYKSLVAKHTLHIIRKFKKKGKILEIGPGGGQFLIDAQKAGFEPYAIEVNKKQADFISNELNIPTENKSASDPTGFSSKKFDIIYHKDLLSHLHDPVNTFKNFNKKLKDDGILLFETGNIGDISKYWLRFLGKLSYPEHLYHFSKRSISALLKISRFELLECHYYPIVLSRITGRALKAVKSFVRIRKRNTDTKKNNNLDRCEIYLQSRSRVSILQKGKDIIFFLLTYQIGKLIPHSLPATVIYICSKKKSEDIHINLGGVQN